MSNFNFRASFGSLGLYIIKTKIRFAFTFYAKTYYHFGPFLVTTLQNLADTSQDIAKRAFSGSPLTPYLENQYPAGFNILHQDLRPYCPSSSNMLDTFQKTVVRASLGPPMFPYLENHIFFCTLYFDI